MAIASLNVNGLRSHLDEIKLVLNDFGIHILALNETKLDDFFPKELTDISAYQQNDLIGPAMEGVSHCMLRTLSKWCLGTMCLLMA